MSIFQQYLEASKKPKTGFLSLKFASIKDADFTTKEEQKLYDKFEELDKGGYGPKSDKQIQILFKLIDLCNDPNGIFMDWDNKYVSKQKAKKYIIKANKE
jgi:hypothetical protein